VSAFLFYPVSMVKFEGEPCSLRCALVSFRKFKGEAAMTRVHAVSTGKMQKCGGGQERYCGRCRGRVV